MWLAAFETGPSQPLGLGETETLGLRRGMDHGYLAAKSGVGLLGREGVATTAAVTLPAVTLPAVATPPISAGAGCELWVVLFPRDRASGVWSLGVSVAASVLG